MKSLKILMLLAALLLPTLIHAQNNGFTPYQCVATVKDGQRSSGSGVYYVKFDGNMAFVKMLYGEDRYKYSGTQSSGNNLYYRQVYNHGTMYQGSGWIENRDSYILVSPDKNTINLVIMGTTFVLKLQTSDSAGDMIY